MLKNNCRFIRNNNILGIYSGFWSNFTLGNNSLVSGLIKITLNNIRLFNTSQHSAKIALMLHHFVRGRSLSFARSPVSFVGFQKNFLRQFSSDTNITSISDFNEHTNDINYHFGDIPITEIEFYLKKKQIELAMKRNPYSSFKIFYEKQYGKELSYQNYLDMWKIESSYENYLINFKKRLENNNNKEKSKWFNNEIKSIYLDLDYHLTEINYLHGKSEEILNEKLSLESILVGDFLKFYELIISEFSFNTQYSILIKIYFNQKDGNLKHSMVGGQEALFLFDNKRINIYNIHKIYTNLTDIMTSYIERYNIQDVKYIQLLYIENNSLANLKLKNINKLSLDKSLLNITQIKQEFNSRLLPLTLDERYYGKRIHGVIENNLVVSLLIENIDIIENIKNSNKDFNCFLDNTRFYQGLYNNSVIIRVVWWDNSKWIKSVYNINGKAILKCVLDYQISDYYFSRQIGNLTLFIRKQVIERTMTNIDFPILKKNKFIYKGNTNPYFGSIDIETFKDDDGIDKVYALGFVTLKFEEENKLFIYYLNDFKSSDEMILSCVNDMLKLCDNYIFYAHNLGGFDVVFIFKTILKYNQNIGYNYYTYDIKFRDDDIIKLTIKIKKEKKGYNKITFVDSYNLLPDALDSLSLSFGSNIKKGLFPYTFVNRDRLNYMGVSPPITYYKKNNKIISINEYSNLYNSNWSLKDETIKYLKRDLLSLLEIMEQFNKYIFINYNIQMTESLTISRLALNIYIKDYLKDSKIAIIKNENIYNNIKQAYFGGVAEVYKPYFVSVEPSNILYYYDVNSLYPYTSKNNVPGNECKYIDSKVPLNLDDLFGFFYAKINTNTNTSYLGLLPYKYNGLIMPNGTWTGWYFSESLKFAKENGYTVEIYKGYQFNKINNVFDEYMDDLYKIKANSTGSKKLIAKYLKNALIGRFGLDIFKSITDIVDLNKFKELLSTKKINTEKHILENMYLVNYNNEISKEICEKHNLDYLKVLNNSNLTSDLSEDKSNFDDVNIAISAAVTDYARIFMNKIKLDILRSGGNIYYMDTDSIVSDKPLPEYLVGKDLGQFKLESKIKEAYFISAKTYCLVLTDEYVTKENKGIIIKAKGVFDSSLTLEDFKSLYNKQNVKAVKSNTKTSWEKGEVSIGTKEVTLNYDAYQKRTKIYDDKGNWVDTKPLLLKDGVLIKDLDFIITGNIDILNKNILNNLVLIDNKINLIEYNLICIKNKLLNKPLNLIIWNFNSFSTLVVYNNNFKNNNISYLSVKGEVHSTQELNLKKLKSEYNTPIENIRIIYEDNDYKLNNKSYKFSENKLFYKLIDIISGLSFKFILLFINIFKEIFFIFISLILVILTFYILENPDLLGEAIHLIRILLQILPKISIISNYSYSYNSSFNQLVSSIIKHKGGLNQINNNQFNFNNLSNNDITYPSLLKWSIKDYTIFNGKFNLEMNSVSYWVKQPYEHFKLSNLQESDYNLQHEIKKIIANDTQSIERIFDGLPNITLNTNVNNYQVSGVTPSISIPVSFLLGRGFNRQNVDPQSTPNLNYWSDSPNTPVSSILNLYNNLTPQNQARPGLGITNISQNFEIDIIDLYID